MLGTQKESVGWGGGGLQVINSLPFLKYHKDQEHLTYHSDIVLKI